MAITRCPYCHAIIDENDKYCNNCGTQLLFAEDEDVEEEIPGEKIIDADVEEKDYTVDEPEGEKKPMDDTDLDEEVEEETEELALNKLIEEEAEEDDVTEEVILLEEIEAAEAASRDKREESEKKAGTAENITTEENEEEEEQEDEDEKDAEEAKEETDEEATEKDEEENEDKGEEEDKENEGGKKEPEEEESVVKTDTEEEPVIEYITDDKDRAEAEPAEEAVPQPVTFDTRELEGLGKTVELGKDKVDKLLEVLAEKRAEHEPLPREVRESTGTLPPWASMMKGEPVFSEESATPGTGEEEGEKASPTTDDEEVEIFPRRRNSDSTLGLPERVSQSPLPFERVEAEAEEKAEEAEEEEEEAEAAPPSLREREAVRPAREMERRPLEVEDVIEEPEPQPPFSFSVFFKSKAFDLLFVGLFWLVALWLAAHSLDMTLFEILGAMSGSMFLLYIVFAFIYFFLFKFFLGETLGDRLFRERD